MLPNPDILNDYPYGKFVLSNLAAKRAKQLSEGAPALVHIDSRHPLTVALAEIAAGKIKPIMGDAAAFEETDDLAVIVGEDMPAELGMLLPALDETEVALVTSEEVLDDHHEDVIESDDLMSLSDLVGEDEEAEVAAGDEDTLSLTDIADQEASEEEGPGDND